VQNSLCVQDLRFHWQHYCTAIEQYVSAVYTLRRGIFRRQGDYGYYRSLMGLNRMLEVELTGQRGHVAIRSGQNLIEIEKIRR